MMRMRLVRMGLLIGLIGFSSLQERLVAVEQVAIDGQVFTIPAGFSLERVAGPPLVDRPICADFDEAGRLYVADSSGSNEPVAEQREKRPHRIVRLEDRDGDGRFDHRVVFADRMMFPEGTLWYDGSLYVAAPPEIWKLTDRDGDGIAEAREVWFDGKTLTGCANDLHGPYLGPDGWIYWCKGAFAEQTYERPGQPPFVTRAAHIFRRRPHGGPIEPVMTGGMDNPVEVVFTPGGERIFTTTFFQHPSGGQRDGLIHAIYGGVYGKQHGVLSGHPRTGPLMPVLAHLGAAAPCGLIRLQTSELGQGYRDNLLTCLFNMRKVTRHVLTPAGASFTAPVEDLIVSSNLDFHPTDVLEDADGSLLLIDTGGWYKLCCPTSQLAKPDLMGAIYRIRRAGAHRMADPRGTDIAWDALTAEQLTELLADTRFAVRDRARQLLARRLPQAVSSLRRTVELSDDAGQRLQAVWALTNIESPAARIAVRVAVDDADNLVRQAAMHSISVWRDAGAESELIAELENPSPHLRRVAAEALGRIGRPTAVPALLAASSARPDRALEHSLIYALIEIGDPAATRVALQQQDPHAVRAALVALDQMPQGGLTAAEVALRLDHADPVVRETAWWIAERHAEWASSVVDALRRALEEQAGSPAEIKLLRSRLGQFIQDAEIQQLVAARLSNVAASVAVREALLEVIAASRLKQLPSAWVAPLHELLATSDPALLQKTLDAMRVFSNAELGDALVGRLRSIAEDQQRVAATRLAALAALPEPLQPGEQTKVEWLCQFLDASHKVHHRALVGDILRRSSLDSAQLGAVADALPTTGPAELKQVMELFATSRDEAVGLRLVAALERCPSLAPLQHDELKQQLAKYDERVLEKSTDLLQRMEAERRAATDQLETILALIDQGDVRRGQEVFRSSRAACISCHAMGYLGGRVGPDLTRIGQTRSARDLLESILFPSASFVRSYEPTTIVLEDGRSFSGVVRDETSDEVTLQLDAERVERISQQSIEERTPGRVSIMPAGLDKQFTPQELADLVVFLKAAQ